MDFCKEKDDIIYDTFASMHVREAAVPDELINIAAENADVAVITLSRFSAEGVDRKPIDSDYYLSLRKKPHRQSLKGLQKDDSCAEFGRRGQLRALRR